MDTFVITLYSSKVDHGTEADVRLLTTSHLPNYGHRQSEADPSGPSSALKGKDPKQKPDCRDPGP